MGNSENQLVTAYKLAQIMGVTRKAVADAVKDGRISFETVDGKKRFDPKKARDEWKENTSESKQRVKAKPSRDDDQDLSEKNQLTYAKARAVREGYAAKLAKLDFEERTKKLINAEDVKSQAFEVGRVIRDSLLALPPRLSAVFAAESDAHKINEALKEEITNVLNQLVFDFERN